MSAIVVKTTTFIRHPKNRMEETSYGYTVYGTGYGGDFDTLEAYAADFVSLEAVQRALRPESAIVKLMMHTPGFSFPSSDEHNLKKVSVEIDGESFTLAHLCELGGVDIEAL